MTTMIKMTNPARPKTNPERGLFWRKEFPIGPEGAVSDGMAVVGAVAAAVNCPPDGGGTEGVNNELFGFQYLNRNCRRILHTWT